MTGRFSSRLLGLAGALAFSTIVASPAAAQGPASASAPVQAVASVAAALAASGTNLDFGTVFGGIPKTVATSDATVGSRAAAHFTITGVANAPVSITWSAVPTDLMSGTDALPIGSWTACSNALASGGAGCSGAVTVGAASPAAIGAAGELHVYVGATVTPATAQPAGAYSGDLTLVVQYTAN